MAEHVSRLPFELDPIIGEAKQRMRRRRLVVAALIILAAGAAIFAFGRTDQPPSTKKLTAGHGGSRSIVLGSVRVLGRDGGPTGGRPSRMFGWGVGRPTLIYMGGDSTSMVDHLTWSHWGSPVAIGSGRTFRLAPAYGPGKDWHVMRIELRASDLGRCTPSGPVAYRKLDARIPVRRGGPLGRWGSWYSSRSLCRPWR
jgi:hypothetical protein